MKTLRSPNGRPLTPKRLRFIAEYLKDLNGTQAATRAGYSPRTANRAAVVLLSNAVIAAAVADGKRHQLERAGLQAERVLEELGRIAFSDIRHFLDEQGHLRPVHTLDEADAACLAAVEVPVRRGKGCPREETSKIRLWDKVRALEQLLKHFGLLTNGGAVRGEPVSAFIMSEGTEGP